MSVGADIRRGLEQLACGVEFEFDPGDRATPHSSAAGAGVTLERLMNGHRCLEVVGLGVRDEGISGDTVSVWHEDLALRIRHEAAEPGDHGRLDHVIARDVIQIVQVLRGAWQTISGLDSLRVGHVAPTRSPVFGKGGRQVAVITAIPMVAIYEEAA